nr:cyclic diguanylate phosphodiesterase (EAL) domain-containing protein [Raoultella sp. NCTC 9187]
MARSLHLKTVAEGVETLDQVKWLQKRGVRYCQGLAFCQGDAGAGV